MPNSLVERFYQKLLAMVPKFIQSAIAMIIVSLLQKCKMYSFFSFYNKHLISARK
jgi:hypothetical protein